MISINNLNSRRQQNTTLIRKQIVIQLKEGNIRCLQRCSLYSAHSESVNTRSRLVLFATLQLHLIIKISNHSNKNLLVLLANYMKITRLKIVVLSKKADLVSVERNIQNVHAKLTNCVCAKKEHNIQQFI